MNHADLRRAVLEVLDQALLLLDAIDSGRYVEKVPKAFNASIGAHLRHCLDHFEVLAAGAADTPLDYDARARDARIETDRNFALSRARALRDACACLSEEALAGEVVVRCKVSYVSDDSPLVSSTLGREAMYTVVHAIHHYALIGIMCQILGIETPEGFGVAPSTLKHHVELAAASA